MDLTSMKCSEEENDDKHESTMVESPEYPYGLVIRLDTEGINKLKLSMPKIGEELLMMGIAYVKYVSESQSTESEPTKCIELQITDLAIKEKKEKSDPAKKLYGE